MEKVRARMAAEAFFYGTGKVRCKARGGLALIRAGRLFLLLLSASDSRYGRNTPYITEYNTYVRGHVGPCQETLEEA